jgi:hypothetical protein
MNVSLDHRGVDPQLTTVLQAQLHGDSNNDIIDVFECLWRQPIDAAVEGIVLGYLVAVEISELPQGHSVGDALAQLAIIPVLDAHQKERAHHLTRGEAVAALARIFQAAAKVGMHSRQYLTILVKQITNGLQRRVELYALKR